MASVWYLVTKEMNDMKVQMKEKEARFDASRPILRIIEFDGRQKIKVVALQNLTNVEGKPGNFLKYIIKTKKEALCCYTLMLPTCK